MIFRGFDELNKVARPRYLIRPVIESGSVGMLFSPSGAGKSFVALDLSCSVATGRDWAGMKVRALPVIYIAAEGSEAFSRRVRGWYHDALDRYEGDQERQALIAHLQHNLCVMPHPVQFTNESVRAELITSIRGHFGADQPIGLIVVDTVARNILGIEENSNTEMGAFVDACYALRSGLGVEEESQGEEEDEERVRNEPAILLIHHTGKAELTIDGDPNARGASALKAGCDFAFALVKSNGVLRLQATKLKDAAEPEPMLVTWSEPVIVGFDFDAGEPITTLVSRVGVAGSAVSVKAEREEKRIADSISIDNRIKDEVTQNPQITTRELSARLDISKTTIGRRMKRMLDRAEILRRDSCYYVNLEPFITTSS